MRPSACIVITPRGSWSVLRSCLESLRPTLGVRDHVVVVATGSDAETDAGLASTKWLTVLQADVPGPATGLEHRAADCSREIVVLLDGDTLVTPHWLEALVTPLADDGVAATGPRTNGTPGTQGLHVPYASGRSSDVTRFARERRQANRAQSTEVPVLDGFALAVRRADLDVLGVALRASPASHRGADLSLSLTGDGRRLLVCEDAFVHRRDAAHDDDGAWLAQRSADRQLLLRKHGSRADVVPKDLLLSACMIVKDEQDQLPACLASLEGLVDEVIVYDTGSTDRTREIAAAAGAVVFEGYWDDDFARARNDALARCSGQWILHVDADEVVEGTPDDIRADLRRRVTDDVIGVRIDNVDDTGRVARSHRAVRLFRRTRGRWHGHLHEQVVPSSGEPLRPETGATPLTLRHVGYTTEVMNAQDKRERNLRVARSEVEASGDVRARVNLGRALLGAGRPAEALEQFAQVRSLTRETVHLRTALRHGSEILIGEGRAQEALEWVAALRSQTASTTIPDYLAGLAHLELGDPETALGLFEGLDELSDEQSTLPTHVLLSRRGLTYVAAGRFAEATDELLAAVRETKAWAPLWSPLVVSCWNSGRPLREVSEVVPDEHLLQVLGHSLHLTPALADGLAEELWQRWPEDARLLAFSSRIAPTLPLARALEWSARLRSAGLDDCPVLALAEDARRDPLERLRAAAVGVEVFDDQRCVQALRAAAGVVEPDHFLDALAAVDSLSARSLGHVVVGAATTRHRSSAMAAVLRTLGADEQADALLLRATA